MATQEKCLVRQVRPRSGQPWLRLGRALAALLTAVGSLAAEPRPQPVPKPTAKRDTGQSVSRRRVLGARPLRMYYYLDDTRSAESLRAYAAEIDLFAPQCFWTDGDGFVYGGPPSRAAEIARAARLAVMPLLFNRGFDRSTVTAMLHSEKAQRRVVSYLAYLSRRDNYVGFQINLENIDPADRHLLTRFVRRAAARLHRDGRLLSVTLIPRFSDTYPAARRPGEFATGEWGAPYDYRALGQVADFLTLMTYDQSNANTPPGPVAGHDWVKKALEYAVRRIPRQKVLLGIPFYGREWTSNGEAPTSRALALKDATLLLERLEISPEWDDRWRSPYFRYRDGSILHTVWFENSRSLTEKLQLVRQYRLRGFAAWRLGSEDPQFWALAAGLRKSRAGEPVRRTATPRARASSARPASQLK